MRLRAVLFVLFLSAPALGQAAPAAMPKNLKGPIEVTADHLSADAKQNRAVYSGHVELRQGNMSILAQQVTIEGGQKNLQRVVATGNPVHLQQLNRRGEARQVIYEPQKDAVTLLGGARLWEGKDEVSGERIVYFLQQQRTEVSSGGQGRVKSVFYPKQQGASASAPAGSSAAP